MPSIRARADACPGALTTHHADDGELARIRVPGGRLTAAQLRVLADCAERLGDGALHLTSRGNLQLRGLCDAPEFAMQLAEAGLLPSATHERVRNIVASPLSGIAGGLADVRPLVPALDDAIRATPELAELPGRFLFGLDDGRGDVGHPADDRIDVCWRAVEAGRGALLLAGADTGVRVATADAAAALVAAAVAFTAVRGDAWQVRELGAEARGAVLEAAGARSQCGIRCAERTECHIGSVRPGTLTQDDGRCAVAAGLVFGMLTASQARLVADLAEGVVVLTPWRSLLVPGLDPAAVDDAARRLAAAGLVLDAAAPELSISACIGRRGCAKAHADVRADATLVISALAGVARDGVRQAHFSGCERRCGRPPGTVDVLAEGTGYIVDGEPVPAQRLAETLKGHPA